MGDVFREQTFYKYEIEISALRLALGVASTMLFPGFVLIQDHSSKTTVLTRKLLKALSETKFSSNMV